MGQAVGNLELVKWTAFALMLVDHWFAYGVGAPSAWSEFAGALVLPLFALAFGAGWAASSKRRPFDVLFRMLAWATLAQLAALAVRGVLPLNILYSFAGGFALHLAVEGKHVVRIERVMFALFALVIGIGAEFGHAGIVVVFSALAWFQGRRDWAAVAGFAGVVALGPFNGSQAALIALPLFVVLRLVPFNVGRVPRAFYALYAAQFVAISAAAFVMELSR